VHCRNGGWTNNLRHLSRPSSDHRAPLTNWLFCFHLNFVSLIGLYAPGWTSNKYHHFGNTCPLCAIIEQLNMPIIRCSDQKGQSLEEFYSEKRTHKDSLEIANVMLSIIDLLNREFSNTTIFGLTSIYHLNLLAHNSYQTDWYVSIIALDERNYHIEYLMPENKRPWSYAKVKGDAKSLEEAMKFISIGMYESNGWPGNEELLSFYKKYN